MNELLSFILSNDEAFKRRLGSLYSDFPLQNDPDGYAINIAAWQRALSSAALAGLIPAPVRRGEQMFDDSKSSRSNALVLSTSKALSAALETREWGRPLALQAVIDESIRTQHMIPLPDFLNSKTSPFKKSWVQLPGAPSMLSILGWGMRQARGLIIGSDYEHSEAPKRLQELDLVLVDNLKEIEKRLMKGLSGQNLSAADRIYAKELFKKQCGEIMNGEPELSATDIEVLLTFLTRDQSSIFYDGETIKFKDSDGASGITQEDKTIASLKALISSLSAQIAGLDTKIHTYRLIAQDAMVKKNRDSALSYLRFKKLAETNQKQRLDTLYQLEQVYSKIEQASDQVDLLRVMDASTNVLKGLNEKVGGIERVEDVVEELRKQMDNVDEIGNFMEEASPPVDEGELDDELEAMEAEETKARTDREAEITRRKLQELDELRVTEPKDKSRLQSAEKVPSTVRTNGDLEESINKLSQMSIDDKQSKHRGQSSAMPAE